MPKVFADNRGGASGLDGETVDLTSPANDDLIQRKSGQWVNRTPAQVATDLGVDGKVAKAGDTMTGVLTLGEINGDVSTETIYVTESANWASYLLLEASSITLAPDFDSLNFSLTAAGAEVTGKLTTDGLQTPASYKSLSSASTYLVTTDHTTIITNYGGTSTRTLYLPTLSSGGRGRFEIYNGNTNAASTLNVKSQGGNALKWFSGDTSPGANEVTLPREDAMTFAFDTSNTWYRIA